MKCPKCGYVRQERDNVFSPPTECPACGVVYAKYLTSENSAAFGMTNAGVGSKRQSPVHEETLKRARDRVERRLRKKINAGEKDEYREQTLQRARVFVSEGIKKRREEMAQRKTIEQETARVDEAAPRGDEARKLAFNDGNGEFLDRAHFNDVEDLEDTLIELSPDLAVELPDKALEGGADEPSAELSDEAPEEVSEEPTVELSDEAPEEVSEEPTAELSDEAPEEVSEEPTAELSDEAPEEVSEEPTAELSDDAPEEVFEEPTVELSDEAPEEVSEEPTVKLSDDAPEEVSEERTAELSDEAPEEVSEEPTVELSDEVSEEVPEELSAELSDEAPEEAFKEPSIELSGIALEASSAELPDEASGPDGETAQQVEFETTASPEEEVAIKDTEPELTAANLAAATIGESSGSSVSAKDEEGAPSVTSDAPAMSGVAASTNAISPSTRPEGLMRLLPAVAWLVLVVGVFGAILSWTTIDSVQPGINSTEPWWRGGGAIALLLGFAYLATGVLGFAFFWVGSMINTHLRELHIMLLQPLLYNQEMMDGKRGSVEPGVRGDKGARAPI